MEKIQVLDLDTTEFCKNTRRKDEKSMGVRYLTILEVSQKQAYIFASNKLQDNITNSAVIAWVMSPEYFEQKAENAGLFNSKDNLVYSGGGHTILEFATGEQAKEFTRKITTTIRKEYPGIEVFAKTLEYDENKNAGENLKALTAALERKKALREAAFHQGSFGVEKVDLVTLTPVAAEQPETVGKMPEAEQRTDDALSAREYGYEMVRKFDELGGSKGKSNFIAVVHIDGNAMGKRVENLYQKNRDASWEEYKGKLKRFSDSIDRDFKEAYKEMVQTVAQNLGNGKLDALDISGKRFPVRRIITAGDDICFVCEGRIGLECAAVFIQALTKKVNAEDGESYAACAGVAIVHQKYPFYRAYELAEQLCSSAKRFGVSINRDLGGEVSSIDWHLEFGEMKDSLEKIREAYKTADGKYLELRPYIVCAPKEVIQAEPYRRYENFKKLIKRIQENELSYSRARLKELRTVLKQGEVATKHYLKFHKIEDIARDSYQDIFKEVDHSGVGTGKQLERRIFLEIGNGKKTEQRAVLFDAVEMVDSFLELEY